MRTLPFSTTFLSTLARYSITLKDAALFLSLIFSMVIAFLKIYSKIMP
jgi:hypothetical protein